MRASAAAVAAALTLLAAFATPAGGDHHGANPAWPQALSPAAGGEREARGVRGCRRPTMRCVRLLERRLRARWRRLDRACDHRAVAALAYLRITEELRRELARRPSLFRHRPWLLTLITTFSNRYFLWSRQWERGLAVPPAWQRAFDAGAHDDISAGQDVLLFSNAHVQRDLPFALAQLGLRNRRGASHKPDHDAVNEINNRIMDPVGEELERRYDPWFTYMDASPSPLDELGVMELVKSWREAAWRSAERLLAADPGRDRARVAADIERRAAAWAEVIATPAMPGYREQRLAHCRAHG